MIRQLTGGKCIDWSIGHTGNMVHMYIWYIGNMYDIIRYFNMNSYIMTCL